MIESGDFYDGVKLETGPGGSCFMATQIMMSKSCRLFYLQSHEMQEVGYC